MNERLREFERQFGRKIMEGEFTKCEARPSRDKARQKTGVACTVAAKGRFPLRIVMDVLGACRLRLCAGRSAARSRANTSHGGGRNGGPQACSLS